MKPAAVIFRRAYTMTRGSYWWPRFSLTRLQEKLPFQSWWNSSKNGPHLNHCWHKAHMTWMGWRRKYQKCFNRAVWTMQEPQLWSDLQVSEIHLAWEITVICMYVVHQRTTKPCPYEYFQQYSALRSGWTLKGTIFGQNELLISPNTWTF